MKWWHFPAALLSALLFTLLLPLGCLVLATVWVSLLLTTGTRLISPITFYGRRNRLGRLPYKMPSSPSKAKPYVSGFGRYTEQSSRRS